MYVEPNSTVWMIAGYPCDPSYKDIVLYKNHEQQFNAVTGKAVKRFNKVSYNRHEPGVFYCEGPLSTIYNCNYMLFINNGFENHYWYAFVTSVEYVNNGTCKVSFIIDEFTTWYYALEMRRCFVEREHVTNDERGANLVPENFELGEYISVRRQEASTPFPDTNIRQDGSLPDGWMIYIASSYSAGGTVPSYGGATGNIFTGLDYIGCTSIDQAKNEIKAHNEAGHADGIVSIFMAPSYFDEPISGFFPRTYSMIVQTSFNDVDGYKPKNNKLFTYPYYFLYATNYRGGNAIYPFEYFKNPSSMTNRDPIFEIAGSISPDTCFTCSPQYYKGQNINYDEGLTLRGLPTCAYNTDFYKAWLAQNKSSQDISALSTGLSAIGSVVGAGLMATGVGAPAGAAIMAGSVMSGLGNLAQGAMANLQASEQAKAQPNQVHGNQASDTLYGLGKFTFGFYTKCIKAKFAKRIDDYWSRFGYPIGEVKIPNTKNRPQWNYVKTQGCKLVGNAPADSIQIIQNIFDNGVTLWHNIDNVGKYNIDNSPS